MIKLKQKKNKKTPKDLKFVSTNISVSFLRSFSKFENGLKKETKISVERNFRSFGWFLFYHSKMLILVVFFAIKLLVPVNIVQMNITWNAEKEQTWLYSRWRWQLKLELASHFNIGEWERVKLATRFASIWLAKEKDFCGAIALDYFFENLLRFTLTLFKERRHL